MQEDPRMFFLSCTDNDTSISSLLVMKYISETSVVMSFKFTRLGDSTTAASRKVKFSSDIELSSRSTSSSSSSIFALLSSFEITSLLFLEYFLFILRMRIVGVTVLRISGSLHTVFVNM